MNSENNVNGFGWFLSAFALGTAVGVTVTLLTTPWSGRETRERLKNAALEVKNAVGQVPAGIRDAAGRAATGTQAVMAQVRDN